MKANSYIAVCIKNNLKRDYDYIICGAGCAGLSLLMRMILDPFFDKKKILAIDKDHKNKNDRTWCFWEKEEDIFENIVHHRWQNLEFHSSSFSSKFNIAPYRYKMIRSIDFYNHVLQAAEGKSNISFLYDDILNVYSEDDTAIVQTGTNTYKAEYVFNSITGPDKRFLFEENNASKPAGVYTLLQHFKGWMIETEDDVFDTDTAGFMDFRVAQTYGSTFVYVLPVSKRSALVEYTLFNEKLLSQQEYEDALKNYINKFLNITSYNISDEEYGIIPMSNYRFSQQQGRVINIGTAGGQTKASSGFTFKFIQKQSKKIVDDLVQQKQLLMKDNFTKKKFHLYDSVLLHVLHHKKMNGDEIFARIFKKNPPQRVLAFLDNETGLWDDLHILSSVPSKIFLPAAFYEMMKIVD